MNFTARDLIVTLATGAVLAALGACNKHEDTAGAASAAADGAASAAAAGSMAASVPDTAASATGDMAASSAMAPASMASQ